MATSRTLATSIPNRVNAAAMNANCVATVTTPKAASPSRFDMRTCAAKVAAAPIARPDDVLAGLADDGALLGSVGGRFGDLLEDLGLRVHPAASISALHGSLREPSPDHHEVRSVLRRTTLSRTSSDPRYDQPARKAEADQSRERLDAERDVTIKLLPIDVGVTFIAYLSALLLRFDGSVPSAYRDRFFSFVVLAIVVQMGMDAIFGLYSEVWRYASHPKTRGIVWAGMGRRLMMAGLVAGSIMLSINAFATVGMRPVPLSVAVLGTIFSLIGIGLVRFLGARFLFRPPGSDTT